MKEQSQIEDMRAAIQGDRERAEQARQRSTENVRALIEPDVSEDPPEPEPEPSPGLFGRLFGRERPIATLRSWSGASGSGSCARVSSCRRHRGSAGISPVSRRI